MGSFFHYFWTNYAKVIIFPPRLSSEEENIVTFRCRGGRHVGAAWIQVSDVADHQGQLVNPPAHGARIVHRVHNTPALRATWDQNIQTMSTRIKQMRSLLQSYLEKLGIPRSWTQIM